MAEGVRISTPRDGGGNLWGVPIAPVAGGPLVQDGDLLILTVATTDATGILDISGRLLRLDGAQVEFNRHITFDGTGVQDETVMTLAAGWIIGFSVSKVSGTWAAGEVQAAVHVGRQQGAIAHRLLCLASGDIDDIKSLGLGAFT